MLTLRRGLVHWGKASECLVTLYLVPRFFVERFSQYEMKPNTLCQCEVQDLDELFKNVNLTPKELHPAQARYIAQAINLFDHEEDIMKTLLELNDATDHMAECLQEELPEHLRTALVRDIRLMNKLSRLLHTFKAQPFIMTSISAPKMALPLT